MEQFIEFNGVKILLTTGQDLSEVQSFLADADVVISVYPKSVKVLKAGDRPVAMMAFQYE